MVRSYRDLPLILYHVQTKERDEPRPRAGVLRTREFVMKDSYTFDRDAAGLEERYQLHVARLRPHHGAHGAALLPRGVRRRHDGRAGRARVHGALRRRRERDRARAWVRGERGGREADAQPVELPPELPRPSRSRPPGLTTGDRGGRARSAVPEGALLKAYPVG